ncbi:hypothetical protein JQC72_05390 [Polycladomyces sp. WAk]|uniref:Death domain-containing protein n=1 Tax=Polycladomyces zharkentensis TaxID=2807616 RepID=A0ABS2WHD0_9BACL|nr:hypothetical protein [Polycladomyces sp. WAk]MBN2908957.1 hypothetical protein [Polycladomyces sp. WAk]
MRKLKKVVITGTAAGLLIGGVLGVHHIAQAKQSGSSSDSWFASTARTQLLTSGGTTTDAKKDKQALVQRVARYLGVSVTEIQSLTERGIQPRQLVPAAVIAKLSRQKIETVLAAKKGKTWGQVAQSFHVDRQAFRRELSRVLPKHRLLRLFIQRHPEVALQTVSAYLGKDPLQLAQLIRQSQLKPRDVIKAAVLAKASGKDIAQVVAMKTSQNTWRDVAQSLGLKREDVRDEARQLKKLFRQQLKKWHDQHRSDESGDKKTSSTGKTDDQLQTERLLDGFDPFSASSDTL